ncbi:MAG: STAS domain-containing protein [Ignavibacteriaceae bacterium]
MFDVKMQNDDEVLLSGRFDASQQEKVDNILNQINKNCTINFKDLQYISSAGLGSLLKAHVRLAGSGFSIKLINMNSHIREVFKYSGLDKVFKID